MSDDMSAYRDVFLSESAEYLQAVTDGLLALEQDASASDAIDTVFRGAHSLKGMAGAMGYSATADLTHGIESMMDAVRQRHRHADSALVDLALRAIDAVRELIEVESVGGTETPDISALLVELEFAAQPSFEPEQESDEPLLAATSDGTPVLVVTVTLEEECVLKSVRAYMAIKRLIQVGTILDTEPSVRDIEDERFERTFSIVLQTTDTPESIRTAIRGVSEVAEVRVVSASDVPQPAVPKATRPQHAPRLSDTQTVRVSIGHLDTMVNLVGELVIVRSRLDSLAREVDSAELLEALGRLEQVSADLQREVMDTRMVPVEQIFNRFPRMIRDLSRDLGKEVVFDMDGLDIELDRTVLDEIGDPIVHLLRNALDHGLEPAEERVSLGKPRSGSVRLSASREREQVRITVSDDGRGIDIERIWAKAVEQGLCHPRERETMSEADIVLLTFEPGFSTAKEQTKVSGRGVGMDVVKGKIEHFGGAVSLDSSPGIGTSVTLTLPLTLAIVQAVLTESHGHVFALPVSAIDEIIDVAETRIETIDGRPVAVLRDGAVVEFVRLEEAVGQVEYAASPPDPDGQIVLLRVNDVVRGLGVRGLLGRREIVIKPLSPIFREVRGVGGATVLGDGRVALILDPRGLYPTGVRK